MTAQNSETINNITRLNHFSDLNSILEGLAKLTEQAPLELSEKSFLFKAEDNSMVGDDERAILKGEFSVIDPSKPPTDGDIVLVEDSNDRSQHLRVYKNKADGSVLTYPLNEYYRSLSNPVVLGVATSTFRTKQHANIPMVHYYVLKKSTGDILTRTTINEFEAACWLNEIKPSTPDAVMIVVRKLR